MVRQMTNRENEAYLNMKQITHDIALAVFRIKIARRTELNEEKCANDVDDDVRIIENVMLEDLEQSINKVLKKYGYEDDFFGNYENYKTKYNKLAEKYSRMLHNEKYRMW